MISRRNKGVIQTSIILILIVGVGYGFYLYNILQVKLKHMDVREQRYLNQHQSLSSQLQVLYAERSRLEGSFQKEKNEHQNTKLELENAKESHENVVNDMELEHRKKYKDLEQTLLSSQNELEDTKQDYNNLKSKHDESVADFHSQLSQLREELTSNEDLGGVLKRKEDEISKLEEQFKEAKEFQSNLNLDLHKYKTEVESYESLKTILKQVGVDVLNIDHPKLGELSAQNRMDLFAHFGGTQKHAEMIENNRNQLEQERLDREAAMVKQEEQRREQLAMKEKQQSLNPNNEEDLTDSCQLPLDQGNCSNKISRFYFDAATSACQPFLYTGCGGNDNNFESFQDCFDKCNIGEKKEMVPQNNNLTPDQQNQQLPNDQDENAINVITSNNDDIGINLNEDENNAFEDNNLNNDEKAQVNDVQAQENMARLAEQKAQNELLQQQQSEELGPKQDNSVKDLDISEIQEKFLENQKEIKKIDEAQFENFDKLLQQKKEKQDFIEGELEEDSEEEGETEDEEEDMGGDLGEDNGMLQDDAFDDGNDFGEEEDHGDEPPAAKIAGEDELPVLDAPFGDRGNEDKEENYEDNYDENNNEDEDYNEDKVGDKAEDYSKDKVEDKAGEQMDDPFEEDENNEDNEEYAENNGRGEM